MAFTQRLLDEGIDPSVGAVGDALDNAMAETTVGSFKNELIRRQGPWRDVDHVEVGTAEWVVWFQHRAAPRRARLLHPRGCRDAPLRSQTRPARGRVTHENQSPDSPGRLIYAKLPRGFFIPTPVGDYNPDWAVAFQAMSGPPPSPVRRRGR